MTEGGNLFIYDPKVDPSQISKDLNKKMIGDENIASKEGEWCISKNIYDAARNADAIIILTEWSEFKNLDWNQISNIMRSPAWIFDTRYLLNPKDLCLIDINYWRIGYGDKSLQFKTK
jgi:UDPglucose 6-dehydrogenase